MDSHAIYEGLRKAFLWGLRVRPISEALELKADEKLLDAGCGFGVFVRHASHCDYTGIDIDDTRIQWAKSKIGETPHRRFLTSGITRTPFASKSFDTALGYGLLHHLTDNDAKTAVAELSRIVKNKIVFSEPVYSRYHWINNLLCKMDQGPFVRTQEAYLVLCETALKITKTRFFYSRNGLAKYLLITATPKGAA